MRLIQQLAVVAAALLASGPLAAQSFPTKPVRRRERADRRAGARTRRTGRPYPAVHRGERGHHQSPDPGQAAVRSSNELDPFSLIGTFEQMLVVNPGEGIRSVPELVSKARAEPLTYGSAGIGSPGHLAFLAFAQRAGITATHVPYKGGAPAVRDMVGGQVDMGFIVIGGVRQHLQSGRLTALATSGKDRSPELPNVPTLSESGYPGFEVTYAYFAMLPKGTSEQVRRFWQDAFREMLSDPKLVERLKTFDTRVVNGDGADARAWIEQSSSRWKTALAGQKLD